MRVINKKSSIFSNEWFYLFLLIPLFEPDIFKCFSWTDNLFIVLKFLILLIICYRYFTLLNIRRITFWIILYCSFLVISTAINQQNIIYAIKKVIECAVISMVIEVGIYYMGVKAIKILFNYLMFLVIINVILFIPFPNGLLTANQDSENYKMYFLAIKNGMINWVTLGAINGIICLFYYNNKISKYKYGIFILFASISIFYTKSSTGIIVWMLFILFMCIYRFIKFNLNLKKILPLLVIFFIGIVLFRIQEYFNDFFVFVFNKNASLTGRTNLWDHAIMYIKKSPLIGYGIREVSLLNFYGRSYTSHNFILELLLNGGIVQLLIFLKILLMIIHSIDKCRIKKLKTFTTVFFIMFFISTLVGSAIYNIHWITIWIILCYADQFDSLIKKSV